MRPHRLMLLVPAVLLVAALFAGCANDNPAAPRAPASFTADANTIALWHMDEGTGQLIANAASSARTLTLGPDTSAGTADPTWSSPGFNGIGAALAFDAAQGEYLRAGGGFAFPTDEFSVEFLVRATDLSTNPTVFGADQVTINITLTAAGEILCDVGDGSNWTRATAQATLADGAWHYVACTYDHQAIRVYFDGALKATVAQVLDFPEFPVVEIGGRMNSFLTGAMDEVRISTVARTATEILTFQQSR